MYDVYKKREMSVIKRIEEGDYATASDVFVPLPAMIL